MEFILLFSILLLEVLLKDIYFRFCITGPARYFMIKGSLFVSISC